LHSGEMILVDLFNKYNPPVLAPEAKVYDQLSGLIPFNFKQHRKVIGDAKIINSSVVDMTVTVNF